MNNKFRKEVQEALDRNMAELNAMNLSEDEWGNAIDGLMCGATAMEWDYEKFEIERKILAINGSCTNAQNQQDKLYMELGRLQFSIDVMLDNIEIN